MTAETHVEWADWGPDAFAEARADSSPILLSLTASWCRPCDEMDAETYGDPRIAAIVNEDFVPVRVDVDRRPRVRDRYNMGGFPSTVFLTPEGTVISGAGYLGPDGLRQVLDRVRSRWDEDGDEAGRIPRALADDEPPAGSLDSSIVSQMHGALEAAYDERAGGWGDEPKFPHPGALEFALKRDREMARRCLEAVSTNLLDDFDGGFYRFAAERDWSGLQHEKLLDDNAALVRAFANAYLYTGEESYREVAERTIDYLTTTLWVPDGTTDRTESDATEHGASGSGAFAASQAPGDPAQHVGDATERSAAEDPPIDGTIYAGMNGLAIDALYTYAGYTDDERAGRYADRALRTVREDCLFGGVVRHVRRGDGADSPECLLVDQARVLRALTTAHSVRGADTLDDARAVADETIDRLRDGRSFVDGPPSGEGLLTKPLRPLSLTAELASTLLDLSILTGDDRYRSVGRAALESFAGASDRFDVAVAPYASAVARYLEEPLVIRVGAEAGADLHRAALRMADHEKVVVSAAADVETGTAVAERGSESTEPATDPETLSSRVRSLGS